MQEKRKVSQNEKANDGRIQPTNKKFQNLALNFQKSTGERTNFYQKHIRAEDDLDFEQKKSIRHKPDKIKTDKIPIDILTENIKNTLVNNNLSSSQKENSPKKQESIISSESELNEPVKTKNNNSSEKSSPRPNKNDPLALIGTFLGEKYKIITLLGQGGMGIVYLANHACLNKKKAIKILPKSPPIPDSDVERFFKEAKIAASIEHPNIVQIYDIEETEKFYYIVMEYVEGFSLDKYMSEYGLLSIKEAINVIKITALGFGAIHNLGLIHRDVKPANFMMTEDGNVKIMDFGIAKDLNNQSSLTGSTIIGTPQFMAPELIAKTLIDHRSDIYSLGSSFYYLLTGKYCFSGSTMQIIYQVVNVEPIPPEEYNSDVPHAISKIIMKMLEKNPEDRFQTMDDVKLALENY